jgi:hypothetical protein
MLVTRWENVPDLASGAVEQHVSGGRVRPPPAQRGVEHQAEQYRDGCPNLSCAGSKLIGGTDPAALQRAAATYTEMFCAVADLKASVAALQPVAAGVACQALDL